MTKLPSEAGALDRDVVAAAVDVLACDANLDETFIGIIVFMGFKPAI